MFTLYTQGYELSMFIELINISLVAVSLAAMVNLFGDE